MTFDKWKYNRKGFNKRQLCFRKIHSTFHMADEYITYLAKNAGIRMYLGVIFIKEADDHIVFLLPTARHTIPLSTVNTRQEFEAALMAILRITGELAR